jgi:hypothetical protein
MNATSKATKAKAAALAWTILTAGGLIVTSTPASAATQFRVAWTGIGVYPRSGPSMDTTKVGAALPDGAIVDVDCETTGTTMSDTAGYVSDIWERLTDGTYIANVFVNTGVDGWTPGIPRCAEPPAPHTYINLFDVGFALNAPHEWGEGCTVQDFDGGPFGRVIVGYSNGTHIVRNGMLAGWLDGGGGPILGCPNTDEYAYQAGVRQDFWGKRSKTMFLGSGFASHQLYWEPGFDRARNISMCVLGLRWTFRTLTFRYMDDHRYLGNAIAAAAAWTNAGVGFNITQVDTPYGGVNIEIKDFYDPNSTIYAKADIPSEWEVYYDTMPPNPINPPILRILVNQAKMDQLDDEHRTGAITHEIGHVLGLAHPDQICDVREPSVMKQGDGNYPAVTATSPQWYDIVNLKQLYGDPIG